MSRSALAIPVHRTMLPTRRISSKTRRLRCATPSPSPSPSPINETAFELLYSGVLAPFSNGERHIICNYRQRAPVAPLHTFQPSSLPAAGFKPKAYHTVCAQNTKVVTVWYALLLSTHVNSTRILHVERPTLPDHGNFEQVQRCP